MSMTLRKLEEQIESLKQQLLALGPMRPGSLSKQYRQPKTKRRPFYQLSYTHRMRSRSEYVRPEDLAVLRRETAAFRRFKTLVRRWIELSLKASQFRVRKAHMPPEH